MDFVQFFSVAVAQTFESIPAHDITLQAIAISFLLSLAGTALIVQVMGWVSWLSPLPNFITLFVGALLAHRVVGGLPLPGMLPVHQIMLTTLIGMTIGTIVILGTLRPTQR
jgi:hypothetical protein